MASLEALKAQGWYISNEGFDKLSENNSLNDIKNIIRKALDVDIRDIGAPVINTEITKNIFGPVVLQILKLKNVSASKAKPNSQTAPRMLKLSLTDGHTNCQALEIKQIPALSLENTVPGTKIFIDGAHIFSGCLLLDVKCCKILGGNVPALVERWELSKLMISHNRVNEDGPPAWVNFGKKIITNLSQQGFKSLENKSKENKEDAEFQTQRQDAISEATQGAVKKVFGGGVKTPITFSSNSNNNTISNVINQNTSIRASNKPTRNKQPKEKTEVEKQEKPSQKVSLFDFLENKLPVSESTSKNPTNIVKVYNEDYKNSETIKFNKMPNKYDNPSKSGPSNRYQANRDFRNDKPNYEYRQPNRNDQRNKYSIDRNDVRQQYQNEKPPRFQKQKQDNVVKFPPNSALDIPRPEMSNQNVKYQNTTKEYRSKPDTNNFINKLANEINSISLYNSKYEHEKLNRPQQNSMIPQQNHVLPQNHSIPQQNHTIQQQNHTIQQQNHSMLQQNNIWKWKTGDRCMAKYWEDNKYYNAVVTGVTNRTCMVEFFDYGNFEEVLHSDCIPIVPDVPQQQAMNSNYQSHHDNQQISGNLEFRRGKGRPFVRNPQVKPVFGSYKGYDT